MAEIDAHTLEIQFVPDLKLWVDIQEVNWCFAIDANYCSVWLEINNFIEFKLQVVPKILTVETADFTLLKFYFIIWFFCGFGISFCPSEEAILCQFSVAFRVVILSK